jgi:hypothetical protein
MARGQKDNLFSWLIVAVIAAFVISAFRDHDVLKIALIVSVVLMIISWIVAMELPTKCGVTTVRGGRCKLDAKGVIFGCRRWHRWEKARARRGKRQQVWEQSQVTGGRGGRGRDIGPQVVTVRIEEDVKSRVTFRCMILTTACTLLTTGLTVATAAF